MRNIGIVTLGSVALAGEPGSTGDLPKSVACPPLSPFRKVIP